MQGNPSAQTDKPQSVVYYIAAAFAFWHVWISSPWDGLIGRIWRTLDLPDNQWVFLLSDKASNLTQNALHFAGFALLAGFFFPLFKRNNSINALNILLVALIAFAAVWMALAENAIYERGVVMSSADKIFAILCVIGAIELTRRTTGLIIPIMIITALLYVTVLGKYLPSVFRFGGLSWEAVLFRSIYGDDALFGNIAFISSGTITVFMIFGAFLLKSGASDFIVALSRSIAGRMRGGAAFVAVIASALTGTISGSAVANTTSTGVITIPMMKRCGFRPQFAAAVEASSSIGGQLMPPIMGAGAFVMAANTQIPYATIVTVSVLPAMLYFASVAMVIRVEALKYQVPLSDEPPMPRHEFYGGGLCFFAPLALLITLLINGYSPSFSAVLAIALLIILSWLTPNKMTPKRIIDALYLGARNSCATALLLVAVGLVINVVVTTGLGNSFSLMVDAWAQGNLWIALILVAIASLILGMGLPTTAAYIVLSILAAPVLAGLIYAQDLASVLQSGNYPDSAKTIILITAPQFAEAIENGLTLAQAKQLIRSMPLEIIATIRPMLLSQSEILYGLLAAHLAIFWLSQDSNVTPPVCLAAFAAAGIANSKPMPTGVEAWKCAKGLYIITALIAFTPIVSNSPSAALITAMFSLFGIYGLVCLIKNYSEGPLQLWQTAGMLIASALCFIPQSSLTHVSLNALGVVGICSFTLLSYKNHKKSFAKLKK